MTIDRELIRQVRALDRYDLRRLLILVEGMLVQRGAGLSGPPCAGREAVEQQRLPKVSYRLESVSCGKRGCSRCPHGPYWYAYWWEGGKVRSRYIGRRLTREESSLFKG